MTAVNLDHLPTANPAARGLYAKGYAAACESLRTLAETGVSLEDLRTIARTNVIPVHDYGRSDYDHGASEAWARFLTRTRPGQRFRSWDV